MKILHVLDHSIPIHSGYSFRTRSIILQQRKLGYQTYHLTSAKHPGGENDREVIDGIEFYRTKQLDGLLYRIPLFHQLAIIYGMKSRLAEISLHVDPDIIHAHSPVLNGLAALSVARRLNRPLVYEVRAFWEDAAVDHGTTEEGSMRYLATRKLETYVLKHADSITTICEGLKQDICQRGIEPDRITVIPNSVDEERFFRGEDCDGSTRESVRKDLSIESDAVVIGFIGSFYSYEGVDSLVKMFAKIAGYYRNLYLLLAGSGPEEKRIRELIESNDSRERIIFLGKVPHDSVTKYYEVADIFIYPRRSLRLTETVTPLKPLEAMAKGKIVIASDVGGHRELISDEENGFLFSSGDEDSLIGRLGYVLARKEDWLRVAENARRFVIKHRTWESSVRRYERAYHLALSNRRR